MAPCPLLPRALLSIPAKSEAAPRATFPWTQDTVPEVCPPPPSSAPLSRPTGPTAYKQMLCSPRIPLQPPPHLSALPQGSTAPEAACATVSVSFLLGTQAQPASTLAKVTDALLSPKVKPTPPRPLLSSIPLHPQVWCLEPPSSLLPYPLHALQPQRCPSSLTHGGHGRHPTTHPSSRPVCHRPEDSHASDHPQPLLREHNLFRPGAALALAVS